MIIRPARPADAPALRALYAPYAEKTAITFDYDVPSLSAFQQHMEEKMARYPFLVLEEAGDILGYACAGPFKDRAAYDWSVETTLYLRMDCRGKGYGRVLYEALEEALRSQGILNAYACIAYADPEDEYLTNASLRFHARMGYALAGRYHQCGYKFGRWYDMVWMEKFLGDHAVPPPVRAQGEKREEL